MVVVGPSREEWNFLVSDNYNNEGNSFRGSFRNALRCFSEKIGRLTPPSVSPSSKQKEGKRDLNKNDYGQNRDAFPVFQNERFNWEFGTRRENRGRKRIGNFCFATRKIRGSRGGCWKTGMEIQLCDRRRTNRG